MYCTFNLLCITPHCYVVYQFALYVGTVYYVLGNIQPRLRSSVHGIQLLLLAKYTTLEEYGKDTILDPFVEDLHKLVSLKWLY